MTDAEAPFHFIRILKLKQPLTLLRGVLVVWLAFVATACTTHKTDSTFKQTPAAGEAFLINGAKVVTVSSRQPEVDTGLVLRGGETLRFSTPSAAIWKDVTVKLRADGSGSGAVYPAYMRLFSRCLAVPKSPAFALHGRVGSGKAFFIGLGAKVTVRDSGPLVLFTNDVPGFYWNNSGAILVQILKSE